eukprot:13511759-Ditylum_brightwellii.AAC.1
MTIQNTWLPLPQWAHDRIIMDVFGTLQLSALTLTQLNAVRLYLGALTLADIVLNDGYYIMECAFTGRTKSKTNDTMVKSRKANQHVLGFMA